MRLRSIAAAMAVTARVAGNGTVQVTAAEGQEKVTLTGCAVKGNGDGDGFLLANSVEQTTRTTTAPTATGSTVSSTTTNEMKSARVLYSVDDDDDEVAKLMGQLVEAHGRGRRGRQARRNRSRTRERHDRAGDQRRRMDARPTSSWPMSRRRSGRPGPSRIAKSSCRTSCASST